MDNFIIEHLHFSDINELATVLTNAFYSNPAYVAVFRDKTRLKEGLFWLFKASLHINNQKEPLTRIIKEKDTGEIIGTYTLIPPEGVKKNISVYSKIGIGSFISTFGLSALTRMLSLDAKNKKVLSDSLGNSQHYYLSMVVIKEEYRGKGIGSAALKQTIHDLIDSKPACRLIGLTTQLPENVTFYSRLGFTTLDEGYITFKESKYYNYNMKFDLP